MRIGAIFARGSCRALKWMGLFGVVFALGAAQAAAQVTVTTPKTVDEGGRLTVSVSAKISVGPGLASPTTITVTPTLAVRTDDSAPETDLSDAEKAAGLTVAEAADYDAVVPATLTLTVQPHPTGGTAQAVSRTLTGSFTVQTRPDLDAEDEGFQITYALANADETNVTAQGGAALALVAASTGAQKVTINDTDDQMFEWKLTTDSPKEGSAINVTLTADPAPVDLNHVTAISVVGAEGYTLDNSSHTFGADADANDNDGPVAAIMVTPPDTDGDRDMDTIMLKAVRGGTNIDRVTPLEIEVADIHGLPMADKISAMAFTDDGEGKKTKTETTSIMEGAEDPVHVTVTVDRGTTGYPSGEKLKVAVTAAPGQAFDYRVEPAEIEIDSGTGKKSADFKLWAAADDDIGMEDLMLHLTAKGATAKNGSGEVMSMFEIMIEDATTPQVSVKDDAYEAIETALGDDPLNPGDEAMIMTDDLFMYDADMYNVSFAVSVQGAAVSASASGEAVTIMARDAGEATVTVTATATMAAGSIVITQDRANVAQLTFPVMVELADLMITLSGPEDINIAEGMSGMVTATANRAVTEDTMVELIQTEGTASPADFTAEPITIMAGEMTGTTMVMAVEDDMMEDMEMLTLEGRVGAMKTNTVSFNLWDAAVPALPIIAQLLLAAFLAIGGYRRYLRR